MVDRLGHPVFAASAEIRRLCNEPIALTRLRLGIGGPLKPMDDAVRDLHKALPKKLPGELDAESPYFAKACSIAKEQSANYRTVERDELKALALYTLDNPKYYELQNEASYNTYAGKVHEDFHVFVDIIGHMNNGLREIARLHRAGDLQPAQPSGLCRLAWIPEQVWQEHFHEAENVVFLAPMSTSPMWAHDDEAMRTASPVWGFLHQHKAGHVPCLLEFDAAIARQAAQLGSPMRPISAFRATEDEWTLPSYVRGRIVSVSNMASPDGSGAVKHVRITGLLSIPPAEGMHALSAEAALMASMTVAAFTAHCHEGEGAIVRTIGALCTHLSRAVAVLNPDGVLGVWRACFQQRLAAGTFFLLTTSLLPIVGFVDVVRMHYAMHEGRPSTGLAGTRVALNWVLNPLLRIVWDGRPEIVDAEVRGGGRVRDGRASDELRSRVQTAAAAAKGAADSLLRRLGLEPEAALSEAEMAELASAIPYDLGKIFQSVKVLLSEACESHGSRAWTQLLIHAQFLSAVLTMQEDVVPLLRDAAPLEEIQQRKFLEPVERLGDGLWEQEELQEQMQEEDLRTEADAPWSPRSSSDKKLPAAQYAWRAAAWLDCLRMQLAVTRILAVLGAPDAGKTTFLEKVFGITSEGGAGLGPERQTPKVNFYRHPAFDEEFAPAYVVDSPGFGDSKVARNNLVRCLLHCLCALGPSVGVVWIMPAKRPEQTVRDELFKLVLPLCRLIVITQVDKRVDDRYEDLRQELQKQGFDFRDKVALGEVRQTMLQTIKDEVIGHLDELCQGTDRPRTVFSVLNPTSWASVEPTDGLSPRGPPWKGAMEDVDGVFALHSAAALRPILDESMDLA